MVDIIETLTACIEAKDIEGLDKASTELNDIIYYIES